MFFVGDPLTVCVLLSSSMSLSKLFILVNCNLVLDLGEHEQSSDGMNENSWSQFNRNKLFYKLLGREKFLGPK